MQVSGVSIDFRVSSMRQFTVPTLLLTGLASFVCKRRLVRQEQALGIGRLSLSSDFGVDFEMLSTGKQMERVISTIDMQKEVLNLQTEVLNRQTE